jgi:single-strand DNA-binding protein
MFSSVTALGIINGDPVLQYTPTGEPLLTFFMNIIRYYQINGQPAEDFLCLKVVVERQEAEQLNTDLAAWQQVLVSGYLITDDAKGAPEIIFDVLNQPRAYYKISAMEVVKTGAIQKDEDPAWLPGYCDVIAVGNLGQDPELRYISSGSAVANLNIAVNRKFSGQDQTIWLRATAWGKTAENCAQYLKKGRQVLARGRLQTDRGENGEEPTNPGGPRIWTAQDGTARASHEISVITVQFLGGGGGGRGTNSGAPSPQDVANSLEDVFA